VLPCHSVFVFVLLPGFAAVASFRIDFLFYMLALCALMESAAGYAGLISRRPAVLRARRTICCLRST